MTLWKGSLMNENLVLVDFPHGNPHVQNRMLTRLALSTAETFAGQSTPQRQTD